MLEDTIAQGCWEVKGVFCCLGGLHDAACLTVGADALGVVMWGILPFKAFATDLPASDLGQTISSARARGPPAKHPPGMRFPCTLDSPGSVLQTPWMSALYARP